MSIVVVMMLVLSDLQLLNQCNVFGIV